MNDTVATILLSSAEVYGRSLAMMNDTNWTTVEADYMSKSSVQLVKIVRLQRNLQL